jgi:methyl-accepting chemotaxis protein
VKDLTPKIKTISENISDISETVKGQTQHVNVTVDEVVDKTRLQAAKVDDMVSAVLGSISHAGTTLQEGVAKPARQVSGVLRGIRVGLETLVREEKR